MPKIYRHTITLTVLSNENDLGIRDIQEIGYHMNDGDLMGRSELVSIEELDGDDAVAACEAIGGDIEFFGIPD